jgi:predicted nucleic acid-binding protein
MHGENLLVVVDTNILLQDLAQSCRAQRRQTLVNAANAGALRLFCAEHIVKEMYDHIGQDAAMLKVPYGVLLTRWEDEYLPLLRVISDNAISEHLLTAAERRRVRHLLASKDVPSVKLALTLGALYLTEDKPARWAVYNERATDEELLMWLPPLQDGGSAEVLGNAAFTAILIPTITVWGLAEFCQTLAAEVPAVFWPVLAVGAGVALARTTTAGLRRTMSALGTTFTVFMECMRPYYEALERFRAAAPATPSWAELSSEVGRRDVLLRAALWTLARHPAGDASASELAKRLADLGVGQSANIVRRALRGNSCFHETSRGRWQVGRPDWVSGEASLTGYVDGRDMPK